MQVLHAAGAAVIAVRRRPEPLGELAGRFERVVADPCDITDEEGTAAVVQRALDRSGRIDVLVNNAGVSEAGADDAGSTAGFRRVLETNVTATYTLSRQAGAAMLARGAGSIINLGSLFGVKGVVGAPAGYAVSKAAVHGLTRQLAAEWARAGVRVNAIAPGPFASGLNGYSATRPRPPSGGTGPRWAGSRRTASSTGSCCSWPAPSRRTSRAR